MALHKQSSLWAQSQIFNCCHNASQNKHVNVIGLECLGVLGGGNGLDESKEIEGDVQQDGGPIGVRLI